MPARLLDEVGETSRLRSDPAERIGPAHESVGGSRRGGAPRTAGGHVGDLLDQRPAPRRSAGCQAIRGEPPDKWHGLFVAPGGRRQAGRELGLVEVDEGRDDRVNERGARSSRRERIAEPLFAATTSRCRAEELGVEPAKVPMPRARSPIRVSSWSGNRGRSTSATSRSRSASSSSAQGDRRQPQEVDGPRAGRATGQRHREWPAASAVVERVRHIGDRHERALHDVEHERRRVDRDGPPRRLGAQQLTGHGTARAHDEPAVRGQRRGGGAGDRVEHVCREQVGVVDHEAPRPGDGLEGRARRRQPRRRRRGATTRAEAKSGHAAPTRRAGGRRPRHGRGPTRRR